MEKKFLIFILILLFPISLCGGVSAADNNSNITNCTNVQLAPVNPAFLNYNNTSTGISPSPIDFSYTEQNYTSTTSFSSNYDLRTLGKVTSVKDQGNAGSCWTFATYGSLESCLLPYEYDDFSENNMKNLLSSIYANGFDRTWDGGGNFLMALAYMARWSGPVNESADPYNDSNGISPTNLSSLKHVQNVLILPERTGPLDNDYIKLALMNYGAVATAMNFDSQYYNPLTNSYYSVAGDLNHAVCIVGWDDNYDKNNFNIVPPGNGAFIIKNSWGTAWGDDGYFYLSYYDQSLGTDVSFVFNDAESTSNYNKNYQYDPLGWTGGCGYDNETGWFSNIFTSTGNDKLAAASFYIYSPNSNYELYVYLNPTTDNPTSGTLSAVKTGTLNSGYWTIKLDSPIKLLTGQKFSIVIKLTTPGYNYPIPTEGSNASSSQAKSSSHQSYISEDGVVWEDLHYIFDENVCIKAFTMEAISPVVSIVDPVNGAVINVVGKVVTVTFSEAVQEGSAFDSISITCGGIPVSLIKTLNNNTLTLRNIGSYGDGKTYIINLPVNAVKDAAGNDLSTVFASSFNIDTTPPNASAKPAGGYYNTSKTVNLSMNESGSIYYTTNGVDPSAGSTLYTNPININDSTIIKFTAFDLAGNQSPVYSENYIIDRVVPTAGANPVGGLFNNSKVVALVMSEQGSIYYTNDGSTPSIGSMLYTGPFEIANSSTIKFFAFDLAGNQSPVYTETYIIDTIAPYVTASPVSGIHKIAQDFTLSSEAGALIEYSTNGGVTWNTYITPIHLSDGKYEFKYRATDLAGNISIDQTSSYTIDTKAPVVTVFNPLNGVTNISADKTITVTFNEAIKKGSNFWIVLKNRYGTDIAFNKSITGNVLTIDPANNLLESKYQLTLHTGCVTDLAGNPLAIKVSYFSIGTSPKVIRTSPASGTTEIARNKTISVTFNEHIQAGNNWINLVDRSGKSVKFSKSISGKVLNLTHIALLAPNTEYYVILHTGCVTDQAGNPLAIKKISFKTGSV